jgi:hypothetical protein
MVRGKVRVPVPRADATLDQIGLLMTGNENESAQTA